VIKTAKLYLTIKTRKVNFDGTNKPFDVRVRITEKGIKQLMNILKEEGLILIENYQIEKVF